MYNFFIEYQVIISMLITFLTLLASIWFYYKPIKRREKSLNVKFNYANRTLDNRRYFCLELENLLEYDIELYEVHMNINSKGTPMELFIPIALEEEPLKPLCIKQIEIPVFLDLNLIVISHMPKESIQIKIVMYTSRGEKIIKLSKENLESLKYMLSNHEIKV